MKTQLDIQECIGSYPLSSRFCLADRLFFAPDSFLDNSELHEAALGALQNLLALVSVMLDAPEVIMLILDGGGHVVCLNDTCGQVLKCSHEKACGSSFCSLFHEPEARAQAQKAIQEILRIRSRHTYESELTLDEGSSRRRIRWSMALTSDGRGHNEYIVVNGMDVTEYRWAEKERQANIELLQLINSINNTQELVNALIHYFHKWSGCDCVAIRLCDGYDFPYYDSMGFSREFIVAENRLRALDEKGDSLRDPNGRPVLECLCGDIISARLRSPPSHSTCKGSFWTNCMTELARKERPLCTRETCHIEGFESMALIPLGSGEKAIGLLQLSDQRRGIFSPSLVSFLERLANSVGIALANRHSEESNLRLVAAVEQAAESFILLDKAQVVKYVNSAFERLSGYSRHDVMNSEPVFLKSGPYPEAFYDHIWQTVASGRMWTGRITNRKKDGTPYEAELTISAVQDELGAISNYIIILRDASHEAKLEKQLRQAQKMEAIGTLAGGIAHDFNNILAPIIGYAEMALRKIPNNDPQRSNFEQIFNGARRAADLVRQILTFSRQSEQERRPLYVGPIVKEALKLLRASLPSTIEIRKRSCPTRNQARSWLIPRKFIRSL